MASKDVSSFLIAAITAGSNAYCERIIGSLRRERLDWLIPLGERHLRLLVRVWAGHYNQERPHLSLGPGFPEPAPGLPVMWQAERHKVSTSVREETCTWWAAPRPIELFEDRTSKL